MNSSNLKVYVLSVNFTTIPRMDDAVFKLTQYLNYNSNIVAYWNYIPWTWCIKTRLHSSQLRPELLNLLNGQFMICEVNPLNVDGVLPQVAWDWFYADPTAPSYKLGQLGEAAKLPSPPALSDLFKK